MIEKKWIDKKKKSDLSSLSLHSSSSWSKDLFARSLSLVDEKKHSFRFQKTTDMAEHVHRPVRFSREREERGGRPV